MSKTVLHTRHFDWLAWRTELSAIDKAIYERICRYGENFQVNFVSMERLAHEEGTSLSTVKRSVKKLVELGLIEVERDGRKNVYTVPDHPWMHEEVPSFTEAQEEAGQPDPLIGVNLTSNTGQSDPLREYLRESSKIEDSIDSSTIGIQGEVDINSELQGELGPENSGEVFQSLLELRNSRVYQPIFLDLQYDPHVVRKDISKRAKLRKYFLESGISDEDASLLLERIWSVHENNMLAEIELIISEKEGAYV